MAPEPIHICIVTTAHPTDDKRVNHKLAQAFCAAGFRVSWVGPKHASYEPVGSSRSTIEFRLYASGPSRIERLRSSGRLRRLAGTVPPVDVYLAPDPDSAEVALRLARKTGARVIFDVHEVFHRTHLGRWLGGPTPAVAQEYFRRRIAGTCSRCSLVIGVNGRVLDWFVGDDDKRMVVRSCAPLWFAEHGEQSAESSDGSGFSVMHGLCGPSRGTLAVLRAMAQAAETVPHLRVIMFAGDGPSGDRDLALSMASEAGFALGLDLREGVPLEEMPAILRGCDAGLIAYGREMAADCLPNRLFEYMAAGLPVIVPSHAGEMVAIVEAEDCGLLADFEDPTSIASAVVQLHNDPLARRSMGLRARDAFLARHNWEHEVQPLIDTIRSWFPDKR